MLVRAATSANSQTLDRELLDELSSIAMHQGCELLSAEFKGGALRLVLDRLEGGVTLADCEATSKLASAYLDVTEFGAGRYTLEVSSPGLDRQLYGPRDYERFLGHAVRVTYAAPETERRRTITGRLAAFHPEAGGTITVDADAPRETLTIPLARIKLARLEIEL